MTERSCGTCTLCCRLEVNGDDGSVYSPDGQWCQHCRPGKGCAIYKDPAKPKVCDTFQCLWLGGSFDEGDRPDRSKLIAVSRDTWGARSGSGEDLARVRVLEVHEMAPGALDSSKGRRMLKLMRNVTVTAEPGQGTDPALDGVQPAVRARTFDGRWRIAWPGGEWEPMHVLPPEAVPS